MNDISGKEYTLSSKDEHSIQKDLERLIEDLDRLAYSKDAVEMSEQTKQLLKISLEQAAQIVRLDASKKLWLEHTINKLDSRDPFEIAKDIDINVLHHDLVEIYGYYGKIHNSRFIVLYHTLKDEFKKFTCAHELGHPLLPPDELTPKLSRITMRSNLKIEREANEFATKLLIDGSHAEYVIRSKFQLLDY